jgi:lipopolysaccharide/colanic/teichoic acid biosynthesis glycosyltransferase
MLYRRYGKRLFDLTLATLGLVLASPVLGLIALAVKLTSRGPVFYVQERIGKDGVPFPFIKFRTIPE